ncbi:Hypothetical protein GbCGDNIH4_0034 [Granulibacter bethesdensis CGDNIH4]|nr:Hypothetical protein GbCGDNIH4_0034 [Granulibacter bethesdensis CGDNIH4]
MMARLAQVETSHAHFREEKTLSQLTKPIISEGSLFYQRPDRLEKTITSPSPETLRVTGDTLVLIHPPEPPHTIDLTTQPALGALVDTVRGALSGNLATLEKHYQIVYESLGGDAWRLILKPIDGHISGFVSIIRMDGIGNKLRQTDTVQANGDRSIMQITPD